MNGDFMPATILKPGEYYITEEPYYEPIANEITIFEAAYENKLALSLKGPTGCGNTLHGVHGLAP